MVAPKVDGAKLKQALKEFGSLDKAVDTLRIQKRALEADVSSLAKKKADRLGEVRRLDNTINKYKQYLADLKEALQRNKQSFEEYINSIKEFMRQYAIFESFVAMLQASPSERKSVGDLAGYILMIGERVWDFYDQPDRLRYLFVNTVLGDHLKCYRCSRCGLQFIANKEPKSYILNFSCPSCGLSWDVHPDDSFLKAMLGSSSKSTETNRTQGQGK
jgi:hypothetical protein